MRTSASNLLHKSDQHAAHERLVLEQLRRGMGGQAVPGSAAGWQCAIQAHDSLLISTVGLPAGVEWKLEVQDERWERPFFTKCTDPNTTLRLSRGSKYSPEPTAPVRVRARFGLVGTRDASGVTADKVSQP